jgi:hypothetical protein
MSNSCRDQLERATISGAMTLTCDPRPFGTPPALSL